MKLSELIMPKETIIMEFPIKVKITYEEYEKYGYTPEEQMANNPRIRKLLNKVL